MKNIQVIIPVCNPDDKFDKLLGILQRQSVNNFKVLIIDSGDIHGYRSLIKKDNFCLKEIKSYEFNHGGTRQWGINICPNAEIYVFLTQDAILVDEFTVEKLVDVFKDENIGCAYGRQLPHDDATFFSRIARKNNYKNYSYIFSLRDREIYGMKTCFISNSFSAYRKKAMLSIGGFPTNTIIGEDMYVAAKMLLHGWKLAYKADACVYHSHNYTVLQEFKRCFDTGVFHSAEPWIRKCFGSAEGEGVKFVIHELKVILKEKPIYLLEMIFRDGMKFIGYRLGLKEKWMPTCVKKHVSMTKSYWK